MYYGSGGPVEINMTAQIIQNGIGGGVTPPLQSFLRVLGIEKEEA